MPGTVLVVDDSRTIRTLVGRALTSGGYHMVEAVDGVDALAKIGGDPAPSLIICDINMPNMNGLDFLDNLRNQGSALPVVILTSDPQPQLVDLARTRGASAWVSKPFKPDSLLSAIHALLAA